MGEVARKTYAWLALIVALMVMFANASMSVLAEAAEGSVDVGTKAEALQQWELILGVVLPLIIAGIIKMHWNRQAQAIAMLATCAVATLGTMYLNGTLDHGADDYVFSFLKVVMATIVMFKGVWQPLGTSTTIQKSINP